MPWQQRGLSQAVGDFSTQWVTFTLDWTPEYIAMYVDGQIYAHFVGGSAGLTDDLFLALTACVMDRVPPTPEDEFPLEYDIDWVRVYAWANASLDG